MAIADRKFRGGERLVSTGKKYAGRTVDVVFHYPEDCNSRRYSFGGAGHHA